MLEATKARIKANLRLPLTIKEEALLPPQHNNMVHEGAWAMKLLLKLKRWNPDKEVGVSYNVRMTEDEDIFGRKLR